MRTILHISDLHRSGEEPVSNDSLVAAMVMDRERYRFETPAVPDPSAIIVSGDLVQGVAIGTDNWELQMREQYEVAADFLDQLSKRFLDGDRKRIIVIPGNHDVCWNTSLSAMELVPENEYPRDLRSALLKPNSEYRWSWKDKQAYRIKDKALYNSRLRFYLEFANSFYGSGVLDSSKPYQLFELFDRKVVVAAFDTTVGNDCFAYSGAIHSGAVARAALEVRDRPHSYELAMAIWHHSIQGGPNQDDYMSLESVNEMIGLGFQLGLHGHQHLSETVSQVVHLGVDQSIAVVSAGSLCAGYRDLPRGTNRQYNLIVVADDFRSARVHVREMGDGGQFLGKRNGAFVAGYADVRWVPRLQISGAIADPAAENARTQIGLAELAVERKSYTDAIEALKEVDMSAYPYARNLLVKALWEQGDWNGIVQTVSAPASVDELVKLVLAHVKVKSFDKARAVLGADTMSDVGTKKALEEQIAMAAR